MALPLSYLPHYTVEDWEKWQGDWELIEGIAFALASPSVYHQLCLSNLIFEIRKNLECPECKVLPEIDYYIKEDTVVRPDLVVSCREIGERLSITPEVVFEILSPSTIKIDEEIKFQIYQKEKVRYYVLVYPFTERERVKVFKHTGVEFDKVFEGKNEVFSFELDDCLFNIDFSKIW